MLNWKIKTKLDLIKPPTEKKVKFNLPEETYFKEGERIQSRNYYGPPWKYGTIIKCLGQLHYLVQLDDGYTLKRHKNQLRRCNVKFRSCDTTPLPWTTKTMESRSPASQTVSDDTAPAVRTQPPTPSPPIRIQPPTSSQPIRTQPPTTRPQRIRKPVVRLNL